MKLGELNSKYDELQLKYGDPELHSIYNGGCTKKPDFCLVFMNPTMKNMASFEEWKGPRSPWIGSKDIWNLFYALNFIEEDTYNKIRSIKGKEWTAKFARDVYKDVSNHKCFITNLGKCTQVDARQLPDKVFQEYLELLEKEIKIISPKVIILFGNQVSSIVLGQNISVSKCRRKLFEKTIENNKYHAYSVFYPVGNGRFNIDKAIEDIKWIRDKEIE